MFVLVLTNHELMLTLNRLTLPLVLLAVICVALGMRQTKSLRSSAVTVATDLNCFSPFPGLSEHSVTIRLIKKKEKRAP